MGAPHGDDHPPLNWRRQEGGRELSEVLHAEERQAESLRVLIVDDHDLFRTGLRNLLEEQGVQVIGEAATQPVTSPAPHR